MRTPRLFCGATVLVLSLLWSEAVLGFGILLSDQPLVSSKIIASRTFVTLDSAGRTVQTTEIHFSRGQESEFLWLLPIDSEGDLELGACNVDFNALQVLTQPRVLLRHRASGTSSCSGNGGEQVVVPDIGAHLYTGTPVQHHVSPEILEQYTERSELQDHLVSEGWMIPVVGRVTGLLDHYVNHSWRFVAVPVSSTLSTGSLCVEVAYNNRRSSASFYYFLPLKTISASTTNDTEVLIYVYDQGSSRPYVDSSTQFASYYAVKLNHNNLRVDSDLQTNYADLFREAISSRAAPAFVIEYSGHPSQSLSWVDNDMDWLTRLRIRLNPGDLPDDDPNTSPLVGSDLALEVIEGSEVSRDYQIIIAAVRQSPTLGLAFATIALVSLTCVARRRRGDCA